MRIRRRRLLRAIEVGQDEMKDILGLYAETRW